MRYFRFKAVAVALGLVLAGCSDPGPETFGQELFEQTCANCHGANGQGGPGRPAIGAGSDAMTLSDVQLLGVMNVGPGAMPSFSRLTAEQLASLVDYIRVLQADPADGE